jgi:hypothetical protein
MSLFRRVGQRLALNRKNRAAPPGLSPAFDQRIPRVRASYQPGHTRLRDRLRRGPAVGEQRRGDGGDAAGATQPPTAPWAPVTAAIQCDAPLWITVWFPRSAQGELRVALAGLGVAVRALAADGVAAAMLGRWAQDAVVLADVVLVVEVQPGQAEVQVRAVGVAQGEGAALEQARSLA